MAPVRIKLRSLSMEVHGQPGDALADLVYPHGAEFPCGGRGQCRGCRVQVLQGTLPITPLDRQRLSDEELARGWRLTCQARVQEDLEIELRQWAAPILADESTFEFVPREGLGIAVDIGTTTLVAQLVDLRSGRVLATQTALNPQSRFGADIMSRLCAALSARGPELSQAVQSRIRAMVDRLLQRAPADVPLVRAVLVGNTAMEHLFLGYEVRGLAAYPFEPAHVGSTVGIGRDFGWSRGAAEAEVIFLPSLGGFVGSDILAVMFATQFLESGEMVGLADLGTNGEIAIGNRDRIYVASTAAGPAFEGAQIAYGMRAAEGAIDRVFLSGSSALGFDTHVIGNTEARGLCGSGLVDAVATGRRLDLIGPSGRLPSKEWVLRDGVALVQKDVRELQLAKGAISAGIRILLDRAGLSASNLREFYLAGAFGNNINLDSALAIGLLPISRNKIRPVGNAALHGAKLALFREELSALWGQLQGRVEHICLEKHPEFQDWYADSMELPDSEELAEFDSFATTEVA